MFQLKPEASRLKPAVEGWPEMPVGGNAGWFQRRDRGERRGETAVPSFRFRVPSERQTTTDSAEDADGRR